jgi:hypothetical protein
MASNIRDHGSIMADVLSDSAEIVSFSIRVAKSVECWPRDTGTRAARGREITFAKKEERNSAIASVGELRTGKPRELSLYFQEGT